MSQVSTLLLPAGPDPVALSGLMPRWGRNGKELRTANDEPLPNPAGWCLFGPENRLVEGVAKQLLAAANDALTRAAVQRWNPLLLVGPTGCGKSLLAAAVANAWSQPPADGDQTKPRHVLRMSLTDFRRLADSAIREDRVQAFRQRIRSANLLILEDVHRAGMSRWLADELATTIDALVDAQAMVLMTSAVPATSVVAFDRRMVSRAAGGLSLEVALPEVGTRGEILRRYVEAAGYRIEDDALSLIARQLGGDTRQLVATARQLCELTPSRRAVGVTHVDEWLNRQSDTVSPPVREIAKLVARRLRQPLRELRSPSRRKPVVFARAVAIYLARQLTPLSYEEIGRFFGGRDHTTIAHNHTVIESRLAGDHELRQTVEELRNQLNLTAAKR
ncbi:Chromosomal replication initiator protein DnaA [Botrimarina hoheduenensis]|uniref:Chromosomal replication initiator protein DnaA n=1 Tax=Botrimarina hoheduenensis TaxID=2528000 RepID=A0A5C5W8R1_9BACT|nr:Chromosomal replication initiator protein DnaA [Botrimarina hoheduenensis]